MAEVAAPQEQANNDNPTITLQRPSENDAAAQEIPLNSHETGPMRLNRGPDGKILYDAQELDDALDVQVRHGFIQKVFAIVGFQLLLTIGMSIPIVMNAQEFKTWVVQHQWSLHLAFILPLVMLIAVTCSPQILRSFPVNWLYLLTFTLCTGYTTGVICCIYTPSSVLGVLCVTVAILLGLCLFAFQTKYDFTGAGPYLFACVLAMFAASIILAIVGMSRIAEVIYATLGVALFSFYIVYDVQLIAGGKHHKVRFTVDDYMFAAITLYLDIINLFIMLLRLFGDRSE